MLPEWFGFTNDVFDNIPNTPDVVFVDTNHKEVLTLEVGCAFGPGFPGQVYQIPTTARCDNQLWVQE